MKLKIVYLCCVLCAVCFAPTARAGYDNQRFVWEVTQGLDIVSVDTYINTYDDRDYTGGALAREVYSASDLANCPRVAGCLQNDCCQKKAATAVIAAQNAAPEPETDYDLFIPTDMYIRMGLGYNIGFLTSSARYGGLPDATAASATTWNSQFGLGWNISAFTRAEMDIQIRNFRFENAPWSAYDLRARSQSVGANIYFDLIRRYERTGDLTTRSKFVPFIGLGISAGAIDFDDAGVIPIGFADGVRSAFVAPRATIGVSFALTNLVNLDIAYQYELMLSNGFGWESKNGATSISDIFASLRINF
ncbi:MAG: hypothetical protein FWC61_01075 [Proteobacteria bacterium]|nr:hypothetical protein [Pseudomonadota bacterium]